VPADNSEGEGLAISGNTIFVGSGRYVYVFTQPASGWSGTVFPSARLSSEPAGPISVSGHTVVVFEKVFSKPAKGWAGTIRPRADLYPATPGVSGTLSGLALTGDTAVLSAAEGGHYGCPCLGAVNVFTEPFNGWSGTEVSFPAISPASYTGTLPITLRRPDLFVSGGNAIDVYQLAGRYGTRPRPPSLSSVRLSGLRSGKPRLRFTIATKHEYPVITTVTVRLPPGLAFTANSTRLARGVSIGAHDFTMFTHHGTLTAHLSLPASRIAITARPEALVETKPLQLAIRRLSEHKKHMTLLIKVHTITNVGMSTTSILKRRVS
jgi:hypothetical protein